MSDFSNDAPRDAQHEIFKARVHELESLRESLPKEEAHEAVVKIIDTRIKEIDAAALKAGHESLW